MSGHVQATLIHPQVVIIEIVGQPSAQGVHEVLDHYADLIPDNTPFVTIFDVSAMGRPDPSVREHFATWFASNKQRTRHQIARAFVTQSLMQRMIAQGVIMSLERGRIAQRYVESRDDALAFALDQLATQTQP